MDRNRHARAPGAPVPEFHVELVYQDPYDNSVETFDWTLEQLADSIRIDQMQWNPDFRAFDQKQPLLIDEYEDVKGNWIHVETFVSHQDGSRLTGDELEQIAMLSRGDLPITMKQQRLPLGAETNPTEIPMMSRNRSLRNTRRPLRRTARRNRAMRQRPAALSGAGKKIQELQQQMEAGEITPEEFEAYLEEMEASQQHGASFRIAIARARAATAAYVDAVAAPKSKYDDLLEDVRRASYATRGATARAYEEGQEEVGDLLSTAVDPILDAIGVLAEQLPVEALTHEAARSRVAAIEPADVVLLQNAIKQLSKMESADHAVRMLRDIVDAASEMMRELGG
ncbi:hypothetical protein LCGC14_0468850 [marine sediment metagenome]|uniref:Uncharacterized protein n=1 Tax=marine sediment metagenome TaxID=412755 RepID=A0A0F9SI19_9ZZZZ